MSKGLNLQSVKTENRSLILYLLNTFGALSRKEIASKLSLTPAGVTKICAELIAEGLIKEQDAVLEEGKSGRREIPLSLCLDNKYIFGISADRETITYSISDLTSKLHKKQTAKFTSNLSTVVESAKSFLYNLDKEYNIIAVGVCVVGSVDDSDYGVWNSFELKQLLENEFKLPVAIENNVKAFAQAELIYGNLKNENSILFFKWGAGIGSSIVAGGKVYSGNDNGVAEIGHYIVDIGGKKCRCGRFGCLETVASVDAINEEIKSSKLDKSIIIDHKIDIVALALTNTATILNVQNIAFFGNMFDDETIAKKLIKQCIRYNKNLTEDMINTSSLNSKSDFIGTTAICAKHFFFEREV